MALSEADYRHLAAGFLVAVGMLGMGSAGCSSKPAGEPILIGHISPHAGPDKLIGDHAKQGIQLAVERINQEDKRIAGQKVAVLHVNVEGGGTSAQAQATRLITVNKVAGLLGVVEGDTSEKLMRTVEPYSLPVVMSNPLPVAFGEGFLSAAVQPAQQGVA